MKRLVSFLSGLVLGMIVLTGMLYYFMPHILISTHKSSYDFNTTIRKIEYKIASMGWQHKKTLYVSNEIAAKTGGRLAGDVAVIELFKCSYAAAVLRKEGNRYVASAMPCRIAVWEDDRGDVHVSRINSGLAGYRFFGDAGLVMRKKINSEIEEIVRQIL